MRLNEWVAREGRGAISRLQRATGLAMTTVQYAIRGTVDRYDTAKKISDATNGEVSIKELCEPADGSDADVAATGTGG